MLGGRGRMGVQEAASCRFSLTRQRHCKSKGLSSLLHFSEFVGCTTVACGGGGALLGAQSTMPPWVQDVWTSTGLPCSPIFCSLETDVPLAHGGYTQGRNVNGSSFVDYGPCL